MKVLKLSLRTDICCIHLFTCHKYFSGQEDTISLYVKDIIKISSIPWLMMFTLIEISIYILISYELYKHDKLMKMVLPPDAIKCRMKRNAIDLFSHACQFLLVLCFSLIWIASTRIFESFTLLFPILFLNVQKVIHVLVHLSLRPQLRKGIKDLFH